MLTTTPVAITVCFWGHWARPVVLYTSRGALSRTAQWRRRRTEQGAYAAPRPLRHMRTLAEARGHLCPGSQTPGAALSVQGFSRDAG